eukprot:206196_1
MIHQKSRTNFNCIRIFNQYQIKATIYSVYHYCQWIENALFLFDKYNDYIMRQWIPPSPFIPCGQTILLPPLKLLTRYHRNPKQPHSNNNNVNKYRYCGYKWSLLYTFVLVM